MANFYSYKISKVGYIHDLVQSFASLTSLFLYLSQQTLRQLQIPRYCHKFSIHSTK